jgi:hypothetical protein
VFIDGIADRSLSSLALGSCRDELLRNLNTVTLHSNIHDVKRNFAAMFPKKKALPPMCDKRLLLLRVRTYQRYERPGLTADEIDEIREAFNLFDTDGSGSIDPQELKAAMCSLGFDSKNPTVRVLEIRSFRSS